MMERGTCSICGTSTLLRASDGMVRKHGDCPGGARPPIESRAEAGATELPATELPATGQTAVYLVRQGKRNEELRYSLRTLANAGIDQVVIVGYRPSWLTNVEHLPTAQSDRSARAKNIRMGYEAIATDGPEEFVLFNDDFFVMKKLEEITPTHRGLLTKLLHKVRPSGYYKGLQAAAELLEPDALAYDAIHTPMPLTRDGLAAALDVFDGTHGVRTVAGSLLDLGGTEHVNAKNPPVERWAGLTYLSTSDKSFRYRDIGAYIRKRFRDPSPFEVPA